MSNNMDKQSYIDEAEKELLHTYNRFSLVLDHGEGVHLYDTDGNAYLDFAAGIAVCALGYSNEHHKEALKAQVDKLLHTSNLYYNAPVIEAADKVLKASKMDRIFFTNSGTEAIEGAIKAAKKYAFTRDGHAGHEIIAMNHSFHGRSIGALSVTGNAHYQEPFEPLMPGVKFADFNDLESVKAQVTDKTCAIIMETIQGEGGIYPAKKEFIEGVRALCDEKDILLILDEIQCGMGRSGEMFAWQNYDVKPDIMTCAKALGCGVPVGAFLMTQRVADKSLAPGDHGTTYGGNPFVGAAVSAVFDEFKRLDIVNHVKEVAPYLEKKLDELVAKFDCLTARRGMGLMQGVECSLPVGKVSAEALNQGLIVITAGSNVLRFVPPLVIEKSDVDEMIEKLETTLVIHGEQEQKAKDTADDTDESTEWCVYICGQVANPGVYRVKPGARVCELVDMAGGMLDTADKSFWNLASELYDGQMLYFPTVEELKSDHIPEGTYTTGIDGSLMKGGAEEHIGVKDGKLNINTATVEQLMALSGIGESKAKSIVEDRAKNGLFSSIEDITRVSGIGEAMFNKIKDDITVN